MNLSYTLIIQTTLFERRLALLQNRTPLEFRIDPDYPVSGPYARSSRLLYRPTSLHLVRILELSPHNTTARVELFDKIQGRLLLGKKSTSAHQGQLILAQVVREGESITEGGGIKGPVLSADIVQIEEDLGANNTFNAILSSCLLEEKNPKCLWQGYSFLQRYLWGYRDNLKSIVVDSAPLAEELSSLVERQELPPHIDIFHPTRHKSSLFESYDLETSWEALESPFIPLTQGGSLILEKTHAGWIYDLNMPLSHHSALISNTHAGVRVIKDIRLKNLSGLIVGDFFSLSSQKNKERLLAKLREEAQKDPLPPHIHAISSLGLLEITRAKRDLSVLEELWALPTPILENPAATDKKLLRALEHRIRAHPDQSAFELIFPVTQSPEFLETLAILESTYQVQITKAP